MSILDDYMNTAEFAVHGWAKSHPVPKPRKRYKAYRILYFYEFTSGLVPQIFEIVVQARSITDASELFIFSNGRYIEIADIQPY
jgi:hypothetical protein